MMDEQRLQALEAWVAQELEYLTDPEIKGDPDAIASFQSVAALIAEVRRVQQQAEGQYCPFCWEQAKNGHTADCALAALLAQEAQ